jgi:hypothetical protein
MAGVQRPVVVGALPTGEWVGFAPAVEGFLLVVGVGDREVADEGPLTRQALVALAIAYFEEVLDEPPPGAAEATHQDLAELVQWLAESATDLAERNAGREALDAVEDGLAGDAVSLLLIALLKSAEKRTPAPEASADPIRFLGARAGALLGR